MEYWAVLTNIERVRQPDTFADAIYFFRPSTIPAEMPKLQHFQPVDSK